MFVQITNGKDWRKSRTPSPNKCATSSLSEQGGEMEYEENGRGCASGGNEGDTTIKMHTVERTPDTATSVPSIVTESPPLTKVQIIESSVDLDKSSVVNKEGTHILGRITETAAKYLPKKSNFGKLFGEKETNISISTIDREMARHNQQKLRSTHHHYGTEFSNSELTDRLRRTKVPIMEDVNISRYKSVGCLAIDYPPHRINFLPTVDWRDPDSVITTIVRVVLCQISLIVILLLWILFGALLFFLTEGPHEYNSTLNFIKEEKSLAFSLATDLRLVNPEDLSWKETIDKYTALHKDIVIKSIECSYGKQKYFWTYSGSLLFATSLITTLGTATPLPITGGGKIGAFIFTMVGLPLHLLLLIHLGRTIALKVQILAKEAEVKIFELRRRISNVRKFGEDLGRDKQTWEEKLFLEEFKPPEWLCHIPMLSTMLYYLFGSLIFGSWEGFPELFTFPINFSSVNYHTSDLARLAYACYLEGFAILTAINVALWRDSPYEGFSAIGTSLRFMTNSVD